MENLAGNIMCDYYIQSELEEAGIKPFELGMAMSIDVPASIIGILDTWYFKRNRRYWVARAKEGKGIPQSEAEILNTRRREEVRVNGYAGGTDVLRWLSSAGRTVDTYHIDSQGGLNALAEVIRRLSGDQ